MRNSKIILYMEATELSLSQSQKKSLWLLSINSFLEYTHLMIYIYMAIILNELFFPEVSAYTMSLLSAFAFCSIFIFRPFGAITFNYIGDNINHKISILITTVMVVISFVLTAHLPTHAQIGIYATILITIYRAIHGIFAVNENIEAEIYLTDITKSFSHPSISFLAISSAFGAVAALGIASFLISSDISWRVIFWIGAIVAAFSAIVRVMARNVLDVTDIGVKNIHKVDHLNKTDIEDDAMVNRKANVVTSAYLFIMNCAWPVYFYYVYIYCAHLLEINFDYSTASVIHHNFIVAIVQLVGVLFVAILNYKVDPLKTLKIKLAVFSVFILLLPHILSTVNSSYHLLLVQSFIVLFAFDTLSVMPIFLKRFSVLKRFTYSSLMYATLRALTYIVASFGIVYLSKHFGSYGIVILMIPINIGCALGIRHFEYLEKISQDVKVNSYFQDSV